MPPCTRLAIGVFVLCAIAAQTAVAQPKNMLAAETTLSLPPALGTDPYGAPMATGLTYSRLGLPFGIAAGISSGLSAFYPRTEGYGRSRMLTWCLNLGYPIRIALDYSSWLMIAPSVGWGMYHRWFEYDSVWQYAARPMAIARIGVDLVTQSGASFGLSLSGSLYLDNAVRASLGFGQSAGFVF